MSRDNYHIVMGVTILVMGIISLAKGNFPVGGIGFLIVLILLIYNIIKTTKCLKENDYISEIKKGDGSKYDGIK